MSGKMKGGVVVGMNERVREGKYHVTVTDNAGCGDRDSLSITRGVDPINVLGMDLLTGPGILCKGQKDISYQSMIQSGMGWISWTHTGSNIAIDPSVDGKMAEVDFGVSATPGYLKVEVMNHCSEKADSIYTAFATDFICNQFANCTPSSLITTGLLLSVNVPAMYSTQTLMTIEAEIVNMPGSMFEPYYQFMAGQAIEFMPGFELGRGIEMAAEIKNCQK